MRISFNMTGQDQIAKALQAMSQKVRRQTLLNALNVAGLPILHRMEQLAPFDPTPDGVHLKTSIVMEPLRSLDGVRMGEHEAAIGIGPSRRAYYGGFVELGTSDTAPQPYMRPAWDAEGGTKAQRIIGAELWTAIKAAT